MERSPPPKSKKGSGGARSSSSCRDWTAAMPPKADKKPAEDRKAEKRPRKEGSDGTRAAKMERSPSPPPKSKEGSGTVRGSSWRDWTATPSGVLGDIAKALPYIDQCRFRAVCHQWNEAASSITRNCRKICSGTSGRDVNANNKKVEVEVEVEVDAAKLHIDYHPHGGRPRSPWLMVPLRREKGTNHHFYLLAKSSNYFIPLNHHPSIGHVVGTSPGGWILHADDYGELHALNIFTLVEIDAPPLATFNDFLEIDRDDQGRVKNYTTDTGSRFHSMSFYSKALIFFFPPPILTSTSSYPCAENNKDDQSGSRVRKGRYLFVVTRVIDKFLAYAWEGDLSWTHLPDFFLIDDFILHNGLIYVVCWTFVVASFDPTVGSESIKYLVRDPALSGAFYIVEISGELWVVIRGRNGCCDISLFRLDKEANEWIEIHDGFGEGLALFLGTNQSLALSTSQFPNFKSGCIYSTDLTSNDNRFPSLDRGVGVFDFKTKSFHFGCHWRSKEYHFPKAFWLLR